MTHWLHRIWLAGVFSGLMVTSCFAQKQTTSRAPEELPRPLKILVVENESEDDAATSISAAVEYASYAGFNVIAAEVRPSSKDIAEFQKKDSPAYRFHLRVPEFQTLEPLMRETVSADLKFHVMVDVRLLVTTSSASVNQESLLKLPVADFGPVKSLLQTGKVSGLLLHPADSISSDTTDTVAIYRKSFVELVGSLRDVSQAHFATIGVSVAGNYERSRSFGLDWAHPSYKDPNNKNSEETNPYAFAHLVDYLAPSVKPDSLRTTTTTELTATERSTGTFVQIHRITRSTPLAAWLSLGDADGEEDYEAKVRGAIEQAGGVVIYSDELITENHWWDATMRALEATPQLPER